MATLRIKHVFEPGTLNCTHIIINDSLIIPTGPRPTKEEMAPLLESINREILQSVYETIKNRDVVSQYRKRKFKK